MSSRPSSGPIDSTESQPSVAHWRSAAVCQARSAAASCAGDLDRQILEPRPDPRRVDDAVAEVAVPERDVRHERRLDELRVGLRPDDPGQHADVAALDEAEAARTARDLRDLPRMEIAPLLAVELRRLGEEERLAGEVDAVAEDVGGGADVGLRR